MQIPPPNPDIMIVARLAAEGESTVDDVVRQLVHEALVARGEVAP